ncbi:hypothetical protein, partial [Pseudomonas aeruginosa]|uniref:hypothetical protein n=4 Tax=Pseudomonas aeruginosa TaxID=287 RepID=UPI002232577D
GLAGSALWVVQLASSRHSVRVVNCLVIEAPFDDGAHSGRPSAMLQQEILGWNLVYFLTRSNVVLWSVIRRKVRRRFDGCEAYYMMSSRLHCPDSK